MNVEATIMIDQGLYPRLESIRVIEPSIFKEEDGDNWAQATPATGEPPKLVP